MAMPEDILRQQLIEMFIMKRAYGKRKGQKQKGENGKRKWNETKVNGREMWNLT